MTEREMLELAAKAAGYSWQGSIGDKFYVCDRRALAISHDPFLWNPLTDPDDALRLAVKLRIEFWFDDGGNVCTAAEDGPAIKEPVAEDPLDATCLAITRAAAEIGASMKEQT